MNESKNEKKNRRFHIHKQDQIQLSTNLSAGKLKTSHSLAKCKNMQIAKD